MARKQRVKKYHNNASLISRISVFCRVKQVQLLEGERSSGDVNKVSNVLPFPPMPPVTQHVPPPRQQPHARCMVESHYCIHVSVAEAIQRTKFHVQWTPLGKNTCSNAPFLPPPRGACEEVSLTSIFQME